VASASTNQTTTVFRRGIDGQAAYRCVCGEVIALDSQHGGVCPSCSRQFSGAVIREANSATLGLGLDGSMTPQLATSSNEPDLYLGRNLSHYKIVNRLGQGGMGAVYLALDESLQRYVAVKVIRSASRKPYDAEQSQRLLQEAVAQARVNHPHVVHIYYVGRDGEDPFFAMELVNGPSLDRQLKEGPLPFPVVIELGLQIVSALERSAAFDIVHGDIKPSNILLPEPYTVKLSDFGLARRMSRDRGDAEKVMGSPDYLSPEAINGAPLDIRSDMYSLGVTLFEMTFGRLPYHHADSSVVTRFNAHQTAPISFPQPWPQPVPGEWRSVLERLMAKEPAQRYGSYSETAGALLEFRWVRKTPAGKFVRGMAWLVDVVLGLMLAGIVMLPFMLYMIAPFLGYADAFAAEVDRPETAGPSVAALTLMDRKWVGTLGMTLGGVTALAVGALLQCAWKNTPGKHLMQLRILDSYGNVPRMVTLFSRFFFQVAPFSIAAALMFVPLPDVVESVVRATAWLFLLVDWAVGLFSRDALTLHDRFFGTRVVLDTTATMLDPKR
jgi:eukaryotic-like serine/threonine-protein kinase